jgi:hypothetical protein
MIVDYSPLYIYTTINHHPSTICHDYHLSPTKVYSTSLNKLMLLQVKQGATEPLAAGQCAQHGAWQVGPILHCRPVESHLMQAWRLTNWGVSHIWLQLIYGYVINITHIPRCIYIYNYMKLYMFTPRVMLVYFICLLHTDGTRDVQDQDGKTDDTGRLVGGNMPDDTWDFLLEDI